MVRHCTHALAAVCVSGLTFTRVSCQSTEQTCSTNSGGTCYIFGCSASLGPTDCISGRCVCQTGFCADEAGTCVRREVDAISTRPSVGWLIGLILAAALARPLSGAILRPAARIAEPEKAPELPAGKSIKMSRAQWTLSLALLPTCIVAGVVFSASALGSTNLAALLAGLGTLGQLVLTVAFFMDNYWDSWFENKMEEAFVKVDIDKTGTVDRAELYAAVLVVYAEVNVWVPVYVPEFEHIMKIMDSIDHDHTGDLEFKEFYQVMKVLSEQLMSRASTQILFTFGCPVLAGYLLSALAAATPAFLTESLPQLVHDLAGYVPESLPAAVLSAMMMALMPLLFQYYDNRASKRASTVTFGEEPKDPSSVVEDASDTKPAGSAVEPAESAVEPASDTKPAESAVEPASDTKPAETS